MMDLTEINKLYQRGVKLAMYADITTNIKQKPIRRHTLSPYCKTCGKRVCVFYANKKEKECTCKKNVEKSFDKQTYLNYTSSTTKDGS